MIDPTKHTILRCIIGSKLYGTDTDTSDTDYMGVCIEPVECVAGFSEFEQDIVQNRTDAGVMTTEAKVYSLRKFLRLALGGNPDVIPLFFVPASHKTVDTAIGRQLQELAPHIVSRKCGVKFLGYMESQRRKMLGERGQLGVTRSALVSKHGYDTKFAMQIIRLGLNGVELLTTGRLTFPMHDSERGMLLRIRNGEVTINEVLQRAGDLEKDLRDAISESPLPEDSNRPLVEDWMITRYWEQWKADRFMEDRLDLAGRGVH